MSAPRPPGHRARPLFMTRILCAGLLLLMVIRASAAPMVKIGNHPTSPQYRLSPDSLLARLRWPPLPELRRLQRLSGNGDRRLRSGGEPVPTRRKRQLRFGRLLPRCRAVRVRPSPACACPTIAGERRRPLLRSSSRVRCCRTTPHASPRVAMRVRWTPC